RAAANIRDVDGFWAAGVGEDTGRGHEFIGDRLQARVTDQPIARDGHGAVIVVEERVRDVGERTAALQLQRIAGRLRPGEIIDCLFVAAAAVIDGEQVIAGQCVEGDLRPGYG